MSSEYPSGYLPSAFRAGYVLFRKRYPPTVYEKRSWPGAGAASAGHFLQLSSRTQVAGQAVR